MYKKLDKNTKKKQFFFKRTIFNIESIKFEKKLKNDNKKNKKNNKKNDKKIKTKNYIVERKLNITISKQKIFI